MTFPTMQWEWKINFIGFKLNWHVPRCTIIRNVLYWLVQVLFTMSTKIVICMYVSLDNIIECIQILEIIWASRRKVQNLCTIFCTIGARNVQQNLARYKSQIKTSVLQNIDLNCFYILIEIIRIIIFTIRYNLSIYSKYSFHAFQPGNSN